MTYSPQTWHDAPATDTPITAARLAHMEAGIAAAGAGSVVVHKFPFAFDTAGLLTGATVYTPTVGDLLMDAWIEVGTLWDGTTPMFDLGDFVGVAYGIFAAANAAVALDVISGADSGYGLDNLLSNQSQMGTSLVGLNAFLSATSTAGKRVVPGRFTSAAPLKITVSQNGTNTGADPVSTQGAAVLYLATVTPV